MFKKEERKEWLDAKLGETIKPFGRASAIAKAIGVSHAVATGWINGSLPRDITTAFEFCDEYGLDLREWATNSRKDAQSSRELRERHQKIVLETRALEKSLGAEFEDDQFLLAMSLIEDELADGVVDVVSKGKKWRQIFSLTKTETSI